MNALEYIAATVEPGITGNQQIVDRVAKIIGGHPTPGHAWLASVPGMLDYVFKNTPFTLRIVTPEAAAATKGGHPGVVLITESVGTHGAMGFWGNTDDLTPASLREFYRIVEDLVPACRISDKTARWRALQEVRYSCPGRGKPSLEVVGGLHDYLTQHPMGNNVVGTVEPGTKAPTADRLWKSLPEIPAAAGMLARGHRGILVLLREADSSHYTLRFLNYTVVESASINVFNRDADKFLAALFRVSAILGTARDPNTEKLDKCRSILKEATPHTYQDAVYHIITALEGCAPGVLGLLRNPR